MTYRRPAPAVPDLRDDDIECAWLGWIEAEYGVVLGDGQLYADSRGLVYAGSEYIARLGRDGRGFDTSPWAAHDWADSIAHMPRGYRGIAVAPHR